MCIKNMFKILCNPHSKYHVLVTGDTFQIRIKDFCLGITSTDVICDCVTCFILSMFAVYIFVHIKLLSNTHQFIFGIIMSNSVQKDLNLLDMCVIHVFNDIFFTL